MHRTEIEENETGRFHHADGELPASFSGPPQGEPVMRLGDVVALVVSDAGAKMLAAKFKPAKADNDHRVSRLSVWPASHKTR
jgi:hypothetical protein